jgi:hypothetical protein
MRTQAAEELEARQTIARLVADFGMTRLLGFVADVAEAEADHLFIVGDRQKATRYMRDFRILQRAVTALRA